MTALVKVEVKLAKPHGDDSVRLLIVRGTIRNDGDTLESTQDANTD